MVRGTPQPVQLNGVGKRYGDRVVLRDVELTLSPTSMVTVEGANGSGKSTLLRLIAGVARPSSGSVIGVPDRVGYLPERFEPPRLMRTDAYLRHAGRLSGLSTRVAQARADALLELLVIRPSPRHPLGALSRGNLQKVGLAQVFLAHHDLVVLDEPRAGLETSAWPVLDQLMADHVGRGALVVSSEHDPAVLAAAADRVLVRGGMLEHHTPPAGPPASGHYRIHGHRLEDPALEPAELVAAVPAAVVEREDPSTVSVRVPAQDKDRVLLWLLGHGWSVTGVEPDERA